MDNNNSTGSRVSSARSFMALFTIMLAMALGSLARPAEAQPFAYITNNGAQHSQFSSFSVIDTAHNPPSVVATGTLPVPAGTLPQGIAVTPDGKHAYVTIFGANTVSVIDTASNTVVGTPIWVPFPQGVAVTPDGTRAYVTTNSGTAPDIVTVIDTASNTVVGTIPVGFGPYGIAITPDGKHAYVTTFNSNTVSVIDTATSTVGATVPVGGRSLGVAVTPDGKHAYVTSGSNNVLVIDTATNTAVATVAVGSFPDGVSVTPDGKHAYVANGNDNTVSVIDTATNKVVATVAVGSVPVGIAVTPDGKHVYVANLRSNNVSVIATASNTMVATVTVGNSPLAVGIVPPPPGVPFLAFGAALAIRFGGAPNQDAFVLQTRFILSSTAPGINPLTQAVTLQAGTFAVTIPPGSFKKTPQGYFIFVGVINGARLAALIEPTGTLQYALQAKAVRASFTGTKNPAYVTLTIGGDSGATSVTAKIVH